MLFAVYLGHGSFRQVPLSFFFCRNRFWRDELSSLSEARQKILARHPYLSLGRLFFVSWSVLSCVSDMSPKTYQVPGSLINHIIS